MDGVFLATFSRFAGGGREGEREEEEELDVISGLNQRRSCLVRGWKGMNGSHCPRRQSANERQIC